MRDVFRKIISMILCVIFIHTFMCTELCFCSSMSNERKEVDSIEGTNYTPDTSLFSFEQENEEITSNIYDAIDKFLNETKHPYLHASYDELIEIRKNVASLDNYSKLLYDKVQAEADEYMLISPGKYEQVSQGHADVQDRVIALMTAYTLEEDEKYLERALEEFEAFETITKWTSEAQLDNTQTGASLAVCYDWLYDYLTDEQRRWTVEILKTKVLDISYRYYINPDELETLRKENDYMNIVCGAGTYNHNVYNNSNLCIAALAIAPHYPEYSAFIIANNIKNIVPYINLIGKGAGHEEPIGYYSYTSEKLINMLSCMNSSLHTMCDIDKTVGFKTTAYYPLYMFGAGPFSFGDTSPSKGTFDTNVLYFAAKYSDNKGLMSLLSGNFEKGRCAKILLWYDAGELDDIEQSEKLSFDKLLYPSNHKQNVAVFRDGFDIDTDFFAAMYTGCASANGHSDAVSGAFCLDAYGERFITPIGLGNYDYPDYWDNFQNGGRWNWYEKRPESANCLVINPSESVGQRVDVTGTFQTFESNEGSAFAVSDLSEVYSDYVTSYKRGIKTCNNRTKIIIQDEVETLEPSEIFWSINTPAQIEIINNESAVLVINEKKVYVQIHSDADYELGIMASEKLPTSPQTDGQRVYPEYRKLYLRAENVSEMNLMVEFTPYSDDAEFDSTISDYIKIDDWKLDNDFEEKPLLDNIFIAGENLDGFKSRKYTYEIPVGYMAHLPEISCENSRGYKTQISVSHDHTEALIHVFGKVRKTLYRLKFIKKINIISTVDVTVGYSNFLSATYLPTNPNDTGTTSHPGTGWPGHLYANGVFKEYYYKIDISDLKSVNVEEATFNFYGAGELFVSFLKLDKSFIPGVTAYKDIPASSEVIAQYFDSAGNGKRHSVDFTKYVNDVIDDGGTSLYFAIVQKSESTSVIADERSYSSWKPELKVKASDKNLLVSDLEEITVEDDRFLELTMVNNTDEVQNSCTLIYAEYENGGITAKNISIMKSGELLPGDSKTLFVQAEQGDNEKVFLWCDNLKPLKFGD